MTTFIRNFLLGLLLLLVVSTTAAQDTTTFTLTCYTVDKDFNMTTTVGYTSVGGAVS